MITTAELHRLAEQEQLRFDQIEKDYVILWLLEGMGEHLSGVGEPRRLEYFPCVGSVDSGTSPTHTTCTLQPGYDPFLPVVIEVDNLQNILDFNRQSKDLLYRLFEIEDNKKNVAS